MLNLKPLNDRIAVAPQIAPEDMKALAEQGYTLVINNRPDGEEPGQPTSAEMKAAAQAAGLTYAHVPVERGIGPSDVADMQEALAQCSSGKTLAFCRSGTRSTMLWAVARADKGDDRAELERCAESAGYSLAPVSHLL
ncbi:TIGR01244 family sulfur transferase [Sphingomicrobium nitratireducens]|uniref:TIGR01244 family sulfur transferase n=1 Tax=Sphingomicrobium nitratireducens TaxID=2964666 RepID=UPI00223EDA4E|nr:TIGR01244 family sulfur transferase [Sphingomicrobium nitratireducens]